MGPQAEERALSRGRAAKLALPQLACVLLCTLAHSACPRFDCEEKTPLVDMEAWRLLTPADDPFAPPAEAPLCTADDIRMEPFGVGGPLALDVDTRSGCGWATLEQPLLEELGRDDALQIHVFYFSQTAFPAAEARVAIDLDSEMLWETRVPIPTSSRSEAPLLTLEREVAKGAPVRFHVGNHGDNSWNLLELSRVRQVLCPLQ